MGLLWWRNRVLTLVVLSALCLVSYISFQMFVRPLSSAVPLSDEPLLSVDAPASHAPLPNVLIVSAFFPLAKSKHTLDDYRWWLSKFVGPITTPIYMFVPPAMESLVRELRGSLAITVNTTYTSPFDVPPLRGLEGAYADMHKKDREKHRHSPELYAIWAGKAFFLDEGVRNYNRLFSSDSREVHYAFWSDAGSFRDEHVYQDWPGVQRVEEVFTEGERVSGTRKEDLLFFPMYDAPSWWRRTWQEKDGPVDTEFSEGSFFGGSPSTISWWRTLYFAYHDHYLSRGLFVGKDQTLINALLLLFPSRIITTHPRSPSPPYVPLLDAGPQGACGPEWFYYQFFFADEGEREGMRGIWDGVVSGLWRGNWAWWRRRQRCRLTRVRGMEDVLREAFGRGWRAPVASVGSLYPT